MTPAARPVSLEAPPRVDPSALGTTVPEDPAVRVAFTGRATGNLSLLVGGGDVATARRAALRCVALSPADAVFMQQVHGGDVARVDRTDAGRGAHAADDAIPGVDALVTSGDGVALAVLVADCVPVVLVDPGRGVAAVHAGRGGVVAGVVPTAVRELTPDPSRVVALVGPAIGGCCYEVPADLAARVTADHPAAAATTTLGTPALDLPAAVIAQLDAAGIARVERVGGCTRCTDEVFFSHRSAIAGDTPAGRQAAIVVRSAATAPQSASTTPSLQSP